MDFRRLHTFRTVAALGSFSKAAVALHCSQSTVSTQIRTLEEDLGATLFMRSGTSIVLTGAGERCLDYANKILSIRDEALAKVRGKAKAPVTLSLRMPQSLSERYFPVLLRRFGEKHPQVGFDVSVCAFAELYAELKTGVTDVAFLLADEINGEDLAVKCLATVALVPVAASGAFSGDVFELRHLEKTRLFVPKHDCSYRMRLQRRLLEEGVTPQSVVECNSLTMLKKSVAAGLGVALLPLFCLENELVEGELAVLSSPTLALETGILMIRRKGAWISEELRDFMSICEDEFAKAR